MDGGERKGKELRLNDICMLSIETKGGEGRDQHGHDIRE